MCTRVKKGAASNSDLVVGRGWTSVCVGSGGIQMDGGSGWRAVLLLDRREGLTCREGTCYY